MAGVQKISIAVTPDMVAAMKQVVDTGEYASASEVVREALRAWKNRRDEREQAIERLGRLWDVGIDSGASLDADQAFGELLTEIDGFGENPERR